ncbi:hypothetical protein EIP91_003519 [Steccherinum ochraceum]|uniref:AAA+ ATPase domain-containing protein n=1 Tax=Steccherinum ochraceum TaxID=92696 RepID=A0A4R0S0E8_9APHY|nr:hypothetical protein EIP91_003519 [Steccherinum ochraceum]
MSSLSRRSLQELEDAFIKVSFEPESPTASKHADASAPPVQDPLYEPWFERGSGKFVDPAGFGSVALRKIYPNHTITPFQNVNLLGFPHALVEPASPPDVISSLMFFPLARRLGDMTGILVDSVRFGLFKIAWDKYDYLLYVARYPVTYGEMVVQYLLHEGPAEPSRTLLMACGTWDNALHEEIYVFNQGFWNKDHGLWLEVQKANWKDVILKEEFKTNLKKDVNGFFASEDLYRSLAIPWKRGLIMYGPPGNGKTISMKAIMKESDAKGYVPLYVRSFQSWMGEEAAMAMCFAKARQMSPCVLVLEDLDSLINDRNRSFFLNELDGLEDNDGLLIIGSTNHFDKLDPALSGRPSRFDRKYLFDDPDEEERALYCKYWQNKLKSNHAIEFPDALVDEIAVATEKFSFAYLKEAFVSTLVLLAGREKDDTRDFKTLLKHQVKSLKDQLDKSPENATPPRSPWRTQASSFGPRERDQLLPSQPRFSQGRRFWNANPSDLRGGGASSAMPGALPDGMQHGQPNEQNPMEGRRDVRSMAMAAAALGRSFIV